MSFDPVISVIVPVYNASPFLEATVKSVQAQTYPNWEVLLVIDQKSKDTSAEIARNLASGDSRIQVLTDPSCLGVAANRNFGLQQAKGKYVAFLDADDLWLPEKLERQLNFARQEASPFVFHAYEKMDENGQSLHSEVRAIASLTYLQLLADNSIGCSTVLIEKEWLGEKRFSAGGHEDFCLWLDLLRHSKVPARGLNLVLGRYRIVSGSRSYNKVRAALWRWKILRNREKLNLSRALFYFSAYAFRAFGKRLLPSKS